MLSQSYGHVLEQSSPTRQGMSALSLPQVSAFPQHYPVLTALCFTSPVHWITRIPHWDAQHSFRCPFAVVAHYVVILTSPSAKSRLELQYNGVELS
jgi:hypothetical protein